MAEQKYRVIQRLEAGGMAEVFVGEATSVQGFKKKVAIKRVLPHLAQNEDFIQMFLDEARLSARLNHANIVSVFDISAREDTFFLIMEFVDGANLKKIIEGLRERGKRMTLAQACFVCIEACRGLSYAHELVDESGQPLGIVHRDISPPNIMVTKRGEVKVADFGLAKAGTQLKSTDPGVVKGKFSYLSPEAAQGLEVDARADVFSLGIVLWELLAGKRLFLGENDYATVKLIQAANIPRLAPLNREIDETFEEILLRALARDPRMRYESAREFGDALAGYLYGRQLKVTSYDLASLVQMVVSNSDAGSGPRPTAKLSLIDRLIQEELDESVGVGSSSGTLPTGQGGLGAEHDGGESAFGDFEDPASWFSDDDVARKSSAPLTAEDSRSSQSGAWREAGLVADSSPPPRPPAPRGEAIGEVTDEFDVDLTMEADSDAPAAPAATPPMPVAATAVNAGGQAKAEAPKKSGSGGTVLLLLLLLGAAAAGAFYFTQMQ